MVYGLSALWLWAAPGWCGQRESNPYLPLRRGPFYPLNYGRNTCSCCREQGLYSLEHASLPVRSVVLEGVDQIDRALLPGLGPHCEALRQVVKHKQRAERA